MSWWMGKLTLAHKMRVSEPIMVWKASPKEHGTGRLPCIHSQKAKGYSVGFPFVTQHETEIYGMWPFTFKRIPLNVYLSGNTQEWVSMVIISGVYVTMSAIAGTGKRALCWSWHPVFSVPVPFHGSVTQFLSAHLQKLMRVCIFVRIFKYIL